ncbi:MAG: protein-L-isoaspartate(D-aspartate) O-methyltransferase, partial [Gammaproteobacteria bacterium]|nr:protein-L-isoaspartate(D-aspartate) O-methyltransferase [Gammaproteobacteria bacterium]
PRNRSLAYANHPLPIGHGQTISQPFIVAIMTEVLNVEPHHKVLEIGTGSGYQAAVLSHLAAEVYTIEIVPELAETATKRLRRLGYDNVYVRTGDGWYGWPEHAPFDGVIITAVSDEIPPALLEQLTDDGLLVMPLGDDDGFQELVVYSKRTGVSTPLFPVRFVPLTGDH